MMTNFSIVFDMVDLETACPICGANVRVLPGPSITLDGEFFVCDECAQHGDPALWRVLQDWESAQCALFGVAGGRDHFDTDFWREALA